MGLMTDAETRSRGKILMEFERFGTSSEPDRQPHFGNVVLGRYCYCAVVGSQYLIPIDASTLGEIIIIAFSFAKFPLPVQELRDLSVFE